MSNEGTGRKRGQARLLDRFTKQKVIIPSRKVKTLLAVKVTTPLTHRKNILLL